MSLPLLAVSMGDPAGIGPEILIKAFRDERVRNQCGLLAVGDLTVLESAKEVLGSDLELRSVSDNRQEAEAAADQGMLPVLDLGLLEGSSLTRGEVRAEYGKAAYEYIRRSVQLALADVVDGVVTNPINKASLAAAGVPFAGHTEILAHETGVNDYAMMLAHEKLRVVHVSTHVSLRDACDAVKKERVLAVIRLAADAIRRVEGTESLIAVAGLNPHAGENGLFGREEIEEITPAIEAAKKAGIEVVGPLPPDTLFPRAMGGEFGAVVVMYHDQGHIPLKLAGFQIDPATGTFSAVSGVNITLGLPIIRTSVDHGTAFDLAGTGKASHESLVQAVQYAMRLAGKVPV